MAIDTKPAGLKRKIDPKHLAHLDKIDDKPRTNLIGEDSIYNYSNEKNNLMDID